MYPTAEMLTMEEDTDITFQPVLEAGDAVVFVSGGSAGHGLSLAGRTYD
eukprot:SAG25_NODE_3941_length_923_cov_296.111650_2_plen_49_part_01